ncbi:beta-galactosidase [Kineosporia rhizophila]|uniref:beta-galactosidase n=1 Tax=Kineosporia rhizophila TaxID=84633 RepID=UPI001E629463|nr:beta-galactosidase [Kineosporia rhizophila]
MPELSIRFRDWEEPAGRLPMGDAGAHHRVGLTSRHLLRDGRPWIPVSGEIHYSRVPRERWRERLVLMRSGGIDVVSTYLIWIHHEPVQGQARFDGDLDVAEFVRLCAELDLHVVLRLGPWVHGETRNGGFPDWVQQAPVRHRTDDPGYLELVSAWFQRLGKELAGLCGPDSPVIGLQLENELYTEPGHLLTLKRLAREAGLSAPIWTATAWGGADLPAHEVFPLWAGYGDGFWVDAADGWAPNFRAHFFFSHEWDDPGVGADVRDLQALEQTSTASEPGVSGFPPATCELGGGMASTYHRRIVPAAEDIAAVANAKLGSGSMWQGYYMYAGGLNPAGIGPVQESHATGYPNDLPVSDYDFHAAIGAAGLPSRAHAALRRQHAFLQAFGSDLADMPSVLPEQQPHGLGDVQTLRWALRSDGRSGFVFINWHQPHVPLPTRRNVHLSAELAENVINLGPFDVPPATIARWPIGLSLNGIQLRSATASALTALTDGTLVLVAEAGIDVVVDADAEQSAEGDVLRLTAQDRSATVIVIAAADADRVWVLDDRLVVLSEHPVWCDGGRIFVEADRAPRLEILRADGRRVPALSALAEAERARAVQVSQTREFGPPLASYGSFGGRASAPSPESIAQQAGVFELEDVGEPVAGTRRLLEIEWAGDVAQLCVDDEVVADRFWDGTPWTVDLDTVPGASGAQVSLRILALHPEADVWLDVAALDRRRAEIEPLAALDAVTLSRLTTWSASLSELG